MLPQINPLLQSTCGLHMPGPVIPLFEAVHTAAETASVGPRTQGRGLKLWVVDSDASLANGQPVGDAQEQTRPECIDSLVEVQTDSA